MAWAGWRISRVVTLISEIFGEFRGSQLDTEACCLSILSMRYVGLGLVLCIQISDLHIAEFCSDVSNTQQNITHDQTSLQVCQPVLIRLDERVRDSVERT